MTEKDIEFLQRWLKLMDLVDPSIRGKVNAMAITMTRKYLAITRDGQIEIGCADDPK